MVVPTPIDLIALGRTVLDSTMETCMSAVAEYIKCGAETGVEIAVSPLGAQRRAENGENYVVDYEVQDFAIRLSTEVTPGDIPFSQWLARNPIYGDLIVFAGGVYRVGDDQGNPAFDYTSKYHTSYRIHSIYQEADGG